MAGRRVLVLVLVTDRFGELIARHDGVFLVCQARPVFVLLAWS